MKESSNKIEQAEFNPKKLYQSLISQMEKTKIPKASVIILYPITVIGFFAARATVFFLKNPALATIYFALNYFFYYIPLMNLLYATDSSLDEIIVFVFLCLSAALLCGFYLAYLKYAKKQAIDSLDFFEKAFGKSNTAVMLLVLFWLFGLFLSVIIDAFLILQTIFSLIPIK